MGNDCYYEPTKIPSDACLITFGNNVRVAFGVEFITHDIICQMLNCNAKYNFDRFNVHFAPIKIESDVLIGGGTVRKLR